MFMVEYQSGNFVDAEEINSFEIADEREIVRFTIKGDVDSLSISTGNYAKAVLNAITAINDSRIPFELLLGAKND